MMNEQGAGEVRGGKRARRRASLWSRASGLAALGVLSLCVKACDKQVCLSSLYEPADCAVADECPCKIHDDTQLTGDHCVRLVGCRSDAECPAGTVCLGEEKDALEGEYSACVPLKDKSIPNTRCQIAKDRNEAALINGFGANEFLLERIEGSNGFRFIPPAEAWYVACALFLCAPDVRPWGCDFTNQSVGRIVNYNRCSLSGQPQISSLKASLGGEDTPFVFTAKVEGDTLKERGAECAAANRIQELAARTLTDISVGCWAYDDVGLVGATRLVPLDGDQLKKISGSVLETCPAGDKDIIAETCILPEANGGPAGVPPLGSCYYGECRPRCVTARDCPAREPDSGCEEPVAQCMHMKPQGVATISSYVGVCIYACDRRDLADMELGSSGEEGGEP